MVFYTKVVQTERTKPNMFELFAEVPPILYKGKKIH